MRTLFFILIIFFTDFVTTSDGLLKDLEQSLKEVERSRVKLAQYFCEDESKFKIADCIGIFNTLCLKIADARKVSRRLCFLMFTRVDWQRSVELTLKVSFLPFAGQRGEEEARGAEAAHGGRAEARGGGAGQGGGGGRHPPEEGRASTAALRLGRMCDRPPAGRHQEGRLQAQEEPRVASPGGYRLRSSRKLQ